MVIAAQVAARTGGGSVTETTSHYERKLSNVPVKAAQLLNGLGALPAVRRALLAKGLTRSETDHARRLLAVSLGAFTGGEPSEEEVADTEAVATARGALTELDGRDESDFTRVGGALRRFHPRLAAKFFEGIKPGTGARAIASMMALVQRIRALPTLGEEGVAARRLLVVRGYDEAELARIDALIQLALGAPEAADEEAEVEEVAELIAEVGLDDGEAQSITDEAQRAARVELLAWYEDWVPTIRALIKRKAYLIRMGLAQPARRPDGEPLSGEV